MRLPLYTLFLSFTTLFSLVHSIHPHALNRRDHRHSPPANALTSRQHRVQRDLLDLCINADVNLAANISQILDLGGLLDPTDLGANINLCLCLKDLNIYLETNDDVQALITLLGNNVVSALITGLINTSPDSKQCTFPPHAHHTCNSSDPCHYECDTNYIRNGDTCVCAPPNISCNGVCGSFPQGCGSSVPQKRAEPIRTLAQAKAACKPYETVCGVPGRVSGFAFECVDVNTTKDSCGGCVVPHPFLDQEARQQPAGKDCGSISNVKSSTCLAKQCVVNSCQNGWLPSSTKKECLPSSTGSRIRVVRKRSLPLANIDSGLVSQLVAIVDIVLGFGIPSKTHSSPPAVPVPSSSSTFSTASAIYSLFDDVNRATGNLLTSSTVSGFLSNTVKLLDTSALLKSMLHDCGCIQSLGLANVSKGLATLIASVSSMQDWCAHHSIVPGSAIPSSEASDQPITTGLSGLLDELGLTGKSGASVSGLGSGLTGSANGLLNGANLGPNNYKRSDLADVKVNSTIDSDLLAKIVALVDLIINLRTDTDCLPLSSTLANVTQPSDLTSIVNVNGLVNSILSATGSILGSSTSSSLISSIDNLVQTLEGANTLLRQSGYIDELGLGNLLVDLLQIIDKALEVQSFCHDHPIAKPASSAIPPPTLPSSPSLPAPTHAPSSTTATGDIPIVVGLSDLLTSLGLLGPTKAGVTVAGLGSSLSLPVDNLLDGLGIGPANAKRGTDANVSAGANGGATINSELRTLLEGLADLVINLEGAMPASGSVSDSSDSSSSSLDVNAVLGVAHALGQLLQSKTISALLSNIDAFIDAEEDLQDRFTKCGCVEALGKASGLLQLVGEAADGLKAWCASNPIVAPTPANPSPTSLGPLLPTGGVHLAQPAVSASTLPTIIAVSSPYPSVSSSSAVSGDIPIIIGLNHLLEMLGLGIGIVTVDGLGDGLDTTVNRVANGLGIGPDDVRRRGFAAKRMMVRRQDLMRKRKVRRQIAANANAIVDADLLLQINALIKLILGLNSAATSLPLAAPSIPTHSVAVKPTLAPSPSAPLVPSSVPAGSTPIDFGLVDSIIGTTIALLSSGTVEELVKEVDALVTNSTGSLATLEGCGCVQNLGLDSLYSYLVQIVDVALGLQGYCRSHPALPHGSSPPLAGTPSVALPTSAPSASSMPVSNSNSTITGSGGDEPLVVGLMKLMNGLGINLKADVVVDGLLGNGLDHTVNTVLNVLGVGPNGAR